MAFKPAMIHFASREAMAARLADVIEAQLARALAETGDAQFALSGGSTPAALHRELAGRRLDWERVTATLVDERWVPPGAKGSNESFVRETLAIGAAEKVKVVGMWRDLASPAAALGEVEEAFAAGRRPFDVVLLGMGPDGHTASWFPHADGLDEALHSEAQLCAVTAKPSDVVGDFRQRMTLTLKAIADARFICLMIAGEAKRATFEEAAAGGDVETMPVRAILERRPDLWVAWAP